MASWNGRTAVAWAMPLAVLLLAGCGTDAPRVLAVYGVPESTALEVGVDTCNRNPVVDAEETTEEVRLRVTADEPSGDGAEDCRDSVRLTLEAPLGDRVVVDDSTGEQVPVTAAED